VPVRMGKGQRPTGTGDAVTWEKEERPPRKRLPINRESVNARFEIIDPNGSHKYYFTAGYYPDGEIGEIFVTTSDPAKTVYDALAMSISIGLQHGIPWDVYGRKLIYQGFPPSGPTTSKDRDFALVKSPLDLLAKWMHVRQIKPESKPKGDE
jgi:ribonucleoside-diphosphate reductase alpha chain